jgi:hypothetical protein
LGQSEDQAERVSSHHLNFLVIILGCPSSYGYFLYDTILIHSLLVTFHVDEHLPLQIFINRKLCDSSLSYSYVLAALAYYKGMIFYLPRVKA